jgi:hypothetical protein
MTFPTIEQVGHAAVINVEFIAVGIDLGIKDHVLITAFDL